MIPIYLNVLVVLISGGILSTWLHYFVRSLSATRPFAQFSSVRSVLLTFCVCGPAFAVLALALRWGGWVLNAPGLACADIIPTPVLGFAFALLWIPTIVMFFSALKWGGRILRGSCLVGICAAVGLTRWARDWEIAIALVMATLISPSLAGLLLKRRFNARLADPIEIRGNAINSDSAVGAISWIILAVMILFGTPLVQSLFVSFSLEMNPISRLVCLPPTRNVFGVVALFFAIFAGAKDLWFPRGRSNAVMLVMWLLAVEFVVAACIRPFSTARGCSSAFVVHEQSSVAAR